MHEMRRVAPGRPFSFPFEIGGILLGMRQAGVVLTLALGVALAWASISGATATRPTLRMVDRTPVVIRGVGFAPDERVTVVVAARSRWSKRVTATSGGTFVARFKVVLGRCSRYSIQAFGSTGSRARSMPLGVTADCVPDD